MASSTSSLKIHGGDTVVNYRSIEGHGSSGSSSVTQTEPRSWWASMKETLASEVDGQNSTVPLLGYLFMAGYIDAISFSAIFVWCGFQTGNFAQVSLAIARLIESLYTTPHTDFNAIIGTLTTLPKPDQSSLCSLGAFLLGLLTFGRLGDRVGSRKKGWLVGGTLIQAGLTLGSAITFWVMESQQKDIVGFGGRLVVEGIQGSKSNVLYFLGVACLSMSLGVQGIMARRLNTQFSTTIVLTAVFVELVTDPSLFQVTRPVRSRDQKWLAVAALFLGVVVGRLILGQLGTPLTIGVGVLIRVGIALAWFGVPAVPRVQLP